MLPVEAFVKRRTLTGAYRLTILDIDWTDECTAQGTYRIQRIRTVEDVFVEIILCEKSSTDAKIKTISTTR